MDSPKAIEAWKMDRDALLMRALGETERMARHDMIPERREDCRRDAMVYACLADAITHKVKEHQAECQLIELSTRG